MLLSVNHLTKTYCARNNITYALKNISFSLDKGEKLALIGESGSGKTTLARTICLLSPATGGQIFFGDTAITGASKKEKRRLCRDIRLISQNPFLSFHPRYTLSDSICAVLNNYGLSKTAAELPQLMTELELNETVLRRYPHEVSGGECQRAAILRALCVKPQLLICDEITESLDLPLRASVTHLLDRLCCSRTVACIFITHDIRTALRFAPRVFVLKEGKIDFSGSAREFLSCPTVYTKELLMSLI